MWMGSQEWRGGQDEGARGAVWAQPLLTLHHFALSGREPDVPWKPKIRGKKEPATVSLHPLHNSKHQGRSSSNLFCFFVSVCSVTWQVPPACQVVGAYYIQGVPKKVPFEIHLYLLQSPGIFSVIDEKNNDSDGSCKWWWPVSAGSNHNFSHPAQRICTDFGSSINEFQRELFSDTLYVWQTLTVHKKHL